MGFIYNFIVKIKHFKNIKNNSKSGVTTMSVLTYIHLTIILFQCSQTDTFTITKPK